MLFLSFINIPRLYTSDGWLVNLYSKLIKIFCFIKNVEVNVIAPELLLYATKYNWNN